MINFRYCYHFKLLVINDEKTIFKIVRKYKKHIFLLRPLGSENLTDKIIHSKGSFLPDAANLKGTLIQVKGVNYVAQKWKSTTIK